MSKSVNVGLIGLGGRANVFLKYYLLKMDYVNITAVFDRNQPKVEAAQKAVFDARGTTPFGTTNVDELLARDDVDLVMICTFWDSHVDYAVRSMKAGKFTAMEIGGASNIEECWRLVDTQEETGTPFMFLENTCYGEYELMAMNMAKAGVLGDIVHCEGSYAHDLRGPIAGGLRFSNYLNHNCDNYPTHDLGPIAKLLNINRGNRMVSLSSFASPAKGLNTYIRANSPDNPELCNTKFSQGDVITTVITCANGETILLRLDTTLPRFYSRQFTVRGTRGMYMEDGNCVFLDGVHNNVTFDPRSLWDNAKEYKAQYGGAVWSDPEKLYGQKEVGVDFITLTAMFDSYFNNTIPPIDVYDAAAWKCVAPLSEISIKEGNRSVEFPDFTRGKYLDRKDHNTGLFSLE